MEPGTGGRGPAAAAAGRRPPNPLAQSLPPKMEESGQRGPRETNLWSLGEYKEQTSNIFYGLLNIGEMSATYYLLICVHPLLFVGTFVPPTFQRPHKSACSRDLKTCRTIVTEKYTF